MTTDERRWTPAGAGSAGATARQPGAVNVTRGHVLAERVDHADSFWTRLRGLLGRDELPAGEGLLITHCSSVHTIGMRFPIDVIHIDRHGRVKALIPAMRPGRLGPWVPSAPTVLELPAGSLAGTQVGDVIDLAGCWTTDQRH